MLKRTMGLLLALALLAAAMPGALASSSYAADTPLGDASEAKLNNIRRAVEAIDGTAVPSGGRFSFNGAVGPRVKGRGYRKAPNGRGARVTGGGVAQAATTLYLALLQLGAGVEIDPVKTYGSRFVDDYVQDPDLAVVTDYDAGIDLSFTNAGGDMTIAMWIDEDRVCCAITVAGDSGFRFFSGEGGGSGSDVVLPDLRSGNASRALLGTARLDCGGNEDVIHNVKLAADCVNDTALEKGDTFSFNDIVGPRSKKYGYRRAVNGRGAKVTGGGVAQVASALWLAVKDMDGIAIVEKSTYGESYNQRYVENSRDAILTDYASGRDFSFRYTGQGSVTIYTYVSDGWICCDVYQN